VSPGREAATEAAREAVFQIHELVENILVHLPAMTIFVVQRVSKSFSDAVNNSLPIKEKLFLSRQAKPAAKVMLWGFQHTAAVVNPLLGPVVKVSEKCRDIARQRLRPRGGEGGGEGSVQARRYGIAFEQATLVNKDSSLLKTYLFDQPYKISRLQLQIRVSKDGPWIFVDQRKSIVVLQDWMIGDILQSAMDHECGLVVLSERAARSARQASSAMSWDGSPSRFGDYPLSLSELATDVFQGLAHDARYRITLRAAPKKVIESLEHFCGDDYEFYFCPEQGPTFWMHNVVVPSPEDWAEIEAKKG
jgi:hypothetical protein